MRRVLKPILEPVRGLARKFVGVSNSSDNSSTILSKAANILAAEKVEGDYVEFGVFAGGSFISAYHTLKTVFKQHQEVGAGKTEQDAREIKKIWDGMRFFAFDSFQGLPEIQGPDAEGRDFTAGKYRYTESDFRENLVNAGVDLDKVVTVPGWFEQTCSEATVEKYAMKKASIVHVDCDLYTSAKTVLEFVTPMMTDGTVLIFDDWYCYRGNPNLGEQRAFGEWKEKMTGWVFTEYQKEGPWRNSFIANKV